MQQSLPFSQACENNKQPILTILQQALSGSARVLEIGSGTGQHAVHFAAGLPHIRWQASDRAEYLADLGLRIQAAALANLPAPLLLDITQPTLPGSGFDAVFTANTLHIMPWPVVQQLFNRLNELTADHATLCIYGPFKYQGQFTSDSNRSFDLSLKQRDAAMGIRDVEQVQQLAEQQGFSLVKDTPMPANNQLLWFIKS